MMKFDTVFYVLLSTLVFSEAFQASPNLPLQRSSNTVVFEYIPDGFTKESYAKFKAAEAKKKQSKNLGGLGPRGFKSRSFQSFQEALERGEASHLLPVMNAKERVAKGELKAEDIPVRDYTFLYVQSFTTMVIDGLCL
jgi:hypothetical protein